MLVDLQGFALRVQRRGRHPEPGCRTRRTGGAASGFGQSRLNQVWLLVDSRVVDVSMVFKMRCASRTPLEEKTPGIPYERVTEGWSRRSTTAALAWLPGVCPPLPQRGRCPPAGATDSALLWLLFAADQRSAGGGTGSGQTAGATTRSTREI